DRPSRLVHVRLGLQDGEAVATVLEPQLGELPRELGAEGAVVPAGELVRHAPADVVPRALVRPAWIAEPRHQQIERRRALLGAPKEPQSALGRPGLAGGLAAR